MFEEKNENIIALIDQEKAYDRTERPWIFKVMKKMNFGENIIRWIEILFKNTKSSILVNGVQSRYFPVTRGTRQGDSLSSAIYIIQNEPFLAKIRKNVDIRGIVLGPPQNRVEVKVAGYVDDTTPLMRDRESLSHLLNDVGRFEIVSGSKLNKDKTIGLVSCPEKEGYVDGVQLVYGHEKLLGVLVGAGIDQRKMWKAPIDKMKKKK